MKHIVAISGGKDSTAMALRLKEVEPDRNYQFCITPTGRELPEMHQHWQKLEDLLKAKLIRVPAPTLLDQIKSFKALPNFQMRWCTRIVKIEPFISYIVGQLPAVAYVGIRSDEVLSRGGTDYESLELMVKQDFPLVRWGWGLADVINYLVSCDAVPPKRTDCDFCFYQKLIEWYELWRDHPDRFQEALVLEDWTGHTFRSPQRDSWPAGLRELAKCFEAGQIPKDTRNQKRPTMCAWCAR